MQQCEAKLLDDLVGESEQPIGNSQAERLGGLEIDDQLKLCWRLHGEIGRLLTPEDAVDIPCRQAKRFDAKFTIRDEDLVPKKSDCNRSPARCSGPPAQ